MNDNPYAPPQQQDPAPSQLAAAAYVPLGWRTALASLALGGRIVFGAVVHAFEGSVKAEKDLGTAILVGLSGLGLLASVIGAVVFFLVWIHRASKNLPALGREGMEFTPGWCVGWFFVPFANLVKPMQAVGEIWRASDPEAEDGAWFARPQTSLIGVWWAAWIVGNVLENVSTLFRDKSAPSGLGLVTTGVSGVAAVAIILVMRGVDLRQRQLAAQTARAGT